MANQLLRVHKDELTTKLQLALFTTDPDDNRDLAARVAHLESELAGVSLAFHRHEEALHALVRAAGAYRELGEVAKAHSCLKRAWTLGVGDDETRALLAEALADADLKLAALRPAPVAVQAEEPAPAKKPAEEPAPEAPAEETPADAAQADEEAPAEEALAEAPAPEASEASAAEQAPAKKKGGRKKKDAGEAP